MAVRPKAPQQGNTAAAAAIVALAGLMAAAPALAAPDHEFLGDDSHDATLDISATELSAAPANTSDEFLEDHLLRPGVDATAREVFDDSDDETDAVEEVEAETDDADTAVRSVSDRQPLPLSRRMYRRDI